MKAAKGIMILSLITVLCLGVMGTGMAAGGNGYGRGGGSGAGIGSGAGAGTGTCVNSDILIVDIETYTGDVSEVCSYGEGIEIATVDGEENPMTLNIYGIGPVRYWLKTIGEARPDFGETITVEGKWVTFSGSVETEKFIAFTIFFPDITDENGDTLEIELRDEVTGLPLWRGMGRRWQNQSLAN